MSSVIDPITLGLTVTGLSGVEAHCQCPFHDDSTQSASFNMEKGAFFCFACKKVSNPAEIARLLQSRIVFVPIESLNLPERNAERPDWRWVLSAKKAYGNAYLAKRGVSDALVDEFDIREYEDGVIFLLPDAKGIIVGAQIRFYKGGIKYVFHGDRTVLYPQNRLGESASIVVVEGIFGVLRARLHGHHAFALMSAAIVKQSIPFLAGFREKICVFDDDKAGREAATVMMEAGIGAKVFWPGAEADEEGEDFWDGLRNSPQLVMSF